MALSPALPRAGWKTAGALALLCSGVAMASLPRSVDIPTDEQLQWRALGIAPLASGGATGMRVDATSAVEPIDFVPKRAVSLQPPAQAVASPAPAVAGPLRIRGRAGDGLYWSLRAAGASPQVAAQYLAALASEIDVGSDLTSDDTFQLTLSPSGTLIDASINRVIGGSLDLLRGGKLTHAAAAAPSNWDGDDAFPAPVGPVTPAAGFMWPVNGRITSGFGWRYHPILHYARMHKGIDFGASWGSPIVAAADGQVAAAGWAGGYGRQVRIAHAGGMMTTYSHMSQIVAPAGSFVHQGQLIGYVGSSGLSTGPHLHYEVLRQGVPVNPLSVRFANTQVADTGVIGTMKARLKAMLGARVRG